MPSGMIQRMIGGIPGKTSTGSTLDTARGRALMHSSPDAPGPSQPGTLSSFRSIAYVSDPLMFSEEEATQLKNLSKDMKVGLRHTKAAYKAMEEIDDIEVAVEDTHYSYLEHVSKNEAQRVDRRSKFVNSLERLRVRYAAVEERMSKINADTDQRITSKRAEIRAGLTGKRQKQPALMGG